MSRAHAHAAAMPPTCRVYVTPARYQKLSTRARRVLAAVESANAGDARCWFADLGRVNTITGYRAADTMAGLLQLRDARVLDVVLVAADARWFALVAPWKHRDRLAAAGAELIQARKGAAA